MAEPITPRTAGVRLAPIGRAQWSDRQRAVLGAIDVEGGDSLNLFTTLANHPRLLKHWIPFAGTMLLRSTLTPRQRELLIMRTAAVTNVPYEWVAHVSISKGLGFGAAEVAALLGGPGAELWTPAESGLLAAVDELVADSVISDATWQVLRIEHTDEQLVEIPMIIGAYVMLGYVANSLGIEPDSGSVAITESTTTGGTP